jgi:hypothetical protein
MVCLHGPKGEIIHVQAIFDDGAMISTISTSIYNQVKHQLAGWQPSNCALHMANGILVRSHITWTGTMELGDITTQGTFKVFNSGGG